MGSIILKKAHNIDYAIAEIVKIKNNTFCRTTKETPNNLFLKEVSEEEIKKINLNMFDSQKHSNIYKNTLKVLLLSYYQPPLQICKYAVQQFHGFFALKVFMLVIGSCLVKPAVIKCSQTCKRQRLPCFFTQRNSRKQCQITFCQIVQRTLAVGVSVQILPVRKQQIQLVSPCHVADNIIKQLKTFFKYKS